MIQLSKLALCIPNHRFIGGGVFQIVCIDELQCESVHLAFVVSGNENEGKRDLARNGGIEMRKGRFRGIGGTNGVLCGCMVCGGAQCRGERGIGFCNMEKRVGQNFMRRIKHSTRGKLGGYWPDMYTRAQKVTRGVQLSVQSKFCGGDLYPFSLFFLVFSNYPFTYPLFLLRKINPIFHNTTHHASCIMHRASCIVHHAFLSLYCDLSALYYTIHTAMEPIVGVADGGRRALCVELSVGKLH
ncbi:hypothetical protein VNO78_29036 [Psophocarpus tetragonolobus]|uniref:Uncharacterized protein n=1 Tax=Psophocarpus tetragonolobus TaxID=3891 RepID=A0AAN9RU74_PSOTE